MHPTAASLESRANPIARSPNSLLAQLTPSDYDLIGSHLHNFDLVRDHVLVAAGDELKHAYFPHKGIIGMVVRLARGETTEIATVGSQSVFGASAALGSPTALTTAVVQQCGTCSILSTRQLRMAAEHSGTLRTTLIQHEHGIFVQTQQAAACNVSHPTIARLAWWLLRTRDVTGCNELQFTQEFLAQMLGVHRNAVSVVACTLKDKGLIQFSRAHIRIVDVAGLKLVACECYETVRGELEQLKRGAVQ